MTALFAACLVAAAAAFAGSPPNEPTPPAEAPGEGQVDTATVPVASPAESLLEELRAALDTLQAAGAGLGEIADRNALLRCVVREADPRARLFAPDEWARFLAERNGIVFAPDVRITISNGFPRVASTGPVESGLQVGDNLLEVDAAPVTNVSIGVALARLRAPGGESLAATVLRGGTEATVSVRRVAQPLPAVEIRETWPRDIGYLRVNGFYSNRSEQIFLVLSDWEEAGLAGAILDLRGAGGDDVEVAARLASMFAAPGALLYTFRDRRGNDLERRLAPGESSPFRIPVMVLVDESTTGAAELFAAIASDHLRGVLTLGRPTAGDLLLRDGIALPGSLVAYVATRTLVTGSGTVFDGSSGVYPNILVEADSGGSEFEPPPDPDRTELPEEALDRALRGRVRGDPVLRRALDVLLGLKALNIRAK